MDAVLNEVRAAVLFEIKANWIREETILTADPRAFLDELRKKYDASSNGAERDKGVAQLARSVGALIRREWTPARDRFLSIRYSWPHGVTAVNPLVVGSIPTRETEESWSFPSTSVRTMMPFRVHGYRCAR